jgi:hypothetical protein
LPKSFGAKITFQRNDQASKALLDRLIKEFNRRLDKSEKNSQTQPFQLNNLREFGAHVTKLYFVFNINAELLADNASYYGQSTRMPATRSRLVPVLT